MVVEPNPDEETSSRLHTTNQWRLTTLPVTG